MKQLMTLWMRSARSLDHSETQMRGSLSSDHEGNIPHQLRTPGVRFPTHRAVSSTRFPCQPKVRVPYEHKVAHPPLDETHIAIDTTYLGHGVGRDPRES